MNGANTEEAKCTESNDLTAFKHQGQQPTTQMEDIAASCIHTPASCLTCGCAIPCLAKASAAQVKKSSSFYFYRPQTADLHSPWSSRRLIK